MSAATGLGLAVSTIGRPALRLLLESAARSRVPPVAVAVANQSGGPLALRTDDLPFPVVVIPSSGGASAGRNDAARVLPPGARVLTFPNDDSSYDPEALGRVADRMSGSRPPAAVAGVLLDPDGPRFRLPPAGTPLDRRSVWCAIEPAVFIARDVFEAGGGFDTSLGTGAGTPWGSGEGTDLLLRLLALGATVVSDPDVVVHGPGERRELGPEELQLKHRAYARGTGFVYRRHGYPASARFRILVGPWVKALQHAPSPVLSLHLASARFLGRVEGLRGRPLGTPESSAWRPPPPEPEPRQ